MSYNVKDFGAVGDGETLNTQALQAAVDACYEGGGGQVIVPAGTYLTQTLVLKSNVCLHLEAGSVLLASKDASGYPVICPTPFGNHPGHIQAVLWAEKANNVAVTGLGAVDGGCNSPLTVSGSKDMTFRPALVFFRDCNNVRFQDVTLRWSDFWTLHMLRCNDVHVRGVTIRSHPGRINTDGIDPDGCRNVIISDCLIETCDDCICIKSTEGDLCENITIANCVVSSRCAALKIGTEAIGDIRNITFNNCVVHDSSVALALYMKDGSTYENMIFSNIIVDADSNCPLLVDNTPRYYKEPRKGHVRNITFENIMFRSAGRFFIEGLPDQPIENLTLRNFTWDITGPCDTERQKPGGSRRTERDPDRVNYAVHPYQFIVAHAKNLTVSNIQLNDCKADPGPDRGVLYLHDVRGGEISAIRDCGCPAGTEPVRMDDCENVTLG